MSLQVWLPLNGDLKNQGLSDITVTNSGATVNNNGKIGKCYYFGGQNQITFPSQSWMSMKPANHFSVFCWVKGTTTGWLFAEGGWELLLRPTLAKIGLSNNGQYPAQYSYSFDTNTWYHLGFTWSGSTGKLKLYLNGNLVASSNVPSSANFDIINPFKMCYSSGVYINDFRIYDHALSVKEVKEMSKGLILHYRLSKPMPNLIPETSPIEKNYTYPASNYSDKFSKQTSEIPSKDKYTLSFYAKSTVAGDKIRAHYYNPNTTTTWVKNNGETGSATDGNCNFTLTTQWQKYWVTYSQSSTTAKKTVIFPRMVSGQGTGTVSIKCVKFEEGDKATAWIPNISDPLYAAAGYASGTVYDCSGYQNNGIEVGTITHSSDTPRYRSSEFIQSSDPTRNNNTGLSYIKANIELTTPTAMTVSWWAKPLNGYAGASNNAAWCTSNNNNEPADYNQTAFHHRDARFDICPNSSSSTNLSLTFNQYTLNEWHHYVVVYDGKIAKAYRDAIEISSVTIGSSITPLKSFSYIWIGYSKAGGVWRKTHGYYLDFRVYATALSADDVKALYSDAGYVDKNGNFHAYEFVEI